MKKISLLMIVILIFTLVLSGCGTKKEETKLTTNESVDTEAATTDEVVEEADVDKEPVTLTIYTTQDRTQTRLYAQENFDAFEAAYPHITLELQVVPDDQQETLLQTKLATGEVPDLVHSNWTASNPYNLEMNFINFDDEAWVARLKQPDVLKVPVDGVANNVYMFSPDIPIEGSGIVYNKEVFEAAGITEVPKTYDELLAACESIKNIGVTPFYIPGKDAWTTQIWQTAAIGDIIKNEDPSFMIDLNSNSKDWVDSDTFIDINKKYYNLVELGYTNENILSDDFNTAQEEFLSGSYGMLAMGDFFIMIVESQNPDIQAGIFPVPYRDNASLATGKASGFYIPKDAKNLEEAKLFVDFLSQPEQLAVMQQQASYITNFADGPEGELVGYQLEEMAYINEGNICGQLNDYLLVSTTELWSMYQGMLAGNITPEQVAEYWDDEFSIAMKDKGLDGF